MGLTAGCWSLGMVFGPMLGGALANPVKLYPITLMAEISLFQTFPYLLPNIVTALFAITAFMLVLVFPPETLERCDTRDISGVVEPPAKRGATISELLNTPGVVPALTALFLLSFVDLSFNEIVPLWAMSSRSVGGLAMEQVQIGWPMTLTGVLLVGYTFCCMLRSYYGWVEFLPIWWDRLCLFHLVLD
jgi:hypothetical protein